MRIRDTRSAYFWLFRSCVTRYFGDTLHPLISTCFWVESKIVIAKLSRFEGLCFSYVLLQCILVYILISHLQKGVRTNEANKFSTLLSLHPRWLSSSIYFTFYFTIFLRALLSRLGHDAGRPKCSFQLCHKVVKRKPRWQGFLVPNSLAPSSSFLHHKSSEVEFTDSRS